MGKELYEEMKAVLQLEKEVKDRKDKLRKALIEARGYDAMQEGKLLEHGISIEYRVTTGSVKYSDLPEVKNLTKEYLDQFRGSDRESFVIRAY